MLNHIVMLDKNTARDYVFGATRAAARPHLRSNHEPQAAHTHTHTHTPGVHSEVDDKKLTRADYLTVNRVAPCNILLPTSPAPTSFTAQPGASA